MLILHHIIFLFIIYIQNIDVLCINCYIGDDNELTHCVGDAKICPNKNPIYFFNTTCPTYSSGCLNLGVRKLFKIYKILKLNQYFTPCLYCSVDGNQTGILWAF